MPPGLDETRTVQIPLVKYAGAVGWTVLPSDEALALRGGVDEFFLGPVLREQLRFLNGWLTADLVNEVVARMAAAPMSVEGNEELLLWLRGKRSIYDPVEKRERDVVLVDYEDVGRNQLHVTDEWAQSSGDYMNRADVMFCVNGVPVVIVETKSAKRPDGIGEALDQVRRYHRETPELVLSTQLFDVTHLVDFYYGATWSLMARNLFRWKQDGADTFEVRVKTFFDPTRLLLMLRDSIAFVRRDDGLTKTVLRPHQVRAVDKVLDRVSHSKAQRGLVWHTQGSGKTLTMLTAAAQLLTRPHFGRPLVLMLVDRNELEGQLLTNLVAHGLTPTVAENKDHLRRLLQARHRGLLVSTIHKFEGIQANVETGQDVVVLIDEAHRSTGGDLGTYLMAAVPNATIIGFTGTPIDRSAHGRGTFKVFGIDDEKGYLDKYSIAESISDGATLPLNYALAPNAMRVPRETLEEEFLALADEEGIADVEDLNRVLDRAIKIKAFLKSEERVEAVAKFVAQHFAENVAPLGYKAFLVGVDREACVLLKQALDRHMDSDASRAVYTGRHNDSAELKAHYISGDDEKRLRKAFLDPAAQPQILIVTEKLLTGFDAPVLYCMYLDKPMRDHVLLQAIARVNRPYEDEGQVRKPCGFVVDFVGIFERLEEALAFDSEDVGSVVVDVSVLRERFEELMGEVQPYLDLMQGPVDDKLVEAIIERFRDLDERKAFEDRFLEVERLFEVIAPDSFLRDYLEQFTGLAQIHRVIRAAFGRRSGLSRDLMRKTETLVREQVGVEGLDEVLPATELMPETLELLRKDDDGSAGKVINLAKTLAKAADQAGQQPVLKPIAQRAEQILDRFDNRQIGTQDALAELEEALGQYLEGERLMQELGLAADAVAVRLRLEHAGLPVDELTDPILDVLRAHPEHQYRPSQARDLRAALYRVLIPKVPIGELKAVVDGLMEVEQ